MYLVHKDTLAKDKSGWNYNFGIHSFLRKVLKEMVIQVNIEIQSTWQPFRCPKQSHTSAKRQRL